MNIKVRNQKNYKKLLFCIILDIMGVVTMAIPIVKFVWASISAGLLLKMFGIGAKGKVAAIIGFFEEILPVTDLIPTFTIFWVYETFFEKKSGF
ncbi:MAG: hypothetical protein GKC53_00115 [Neisseriaceae bacterium]|nr:MAG: hypothetical protein GKC53_00115 [Neisseriaceae bacterium]